MKHFLVACLFLFLPFAVEAYVVEKLQPVEPYAIVPVAYDIDEAYVLLSALEGYPVMYEFTIEKPTEIELSLAQPAAAEENLTQYSLIVVRKTDGGVAEVGRLVFGAAPWDMVDDSALGLPLSVSQPFTAQLEPGVYRVEVSTASNEGRYMLFLGSEVVPTGYFATLGNVRAIQEHFGYSFLKMLTSPYIYYPLGIFLLLFAIQRTWKYRKLISHAP